MVKEDQRTFQGKEDAERSILKHGHSKDHHTDLKQMIINLVTTGATGFPIWMEAHSGNASDKKILYVLNFHFN